MNYYQKKIAKLQKENCDLKQDIYKIVHDKDIQLLYEYQMIFKMQDDLDEQFSREHELIMQRLSGDYPKTMEGLYPQMQKKTNFMTKVIVFIKNKLYLWKK